MRKILWTMALVTFLAAAILTSCAAPTVEKREERIDNVVRILMHRPGDYTIFVQKDEELIPRRMYIARDGRMHEGTIFVQDVDPNGPIWAVVRYTSRGLGNWREYYHLEFHVHSPQDINGAGWSTLKHGSGQTVVIE